MDHGNLRCGVIRASRGARVTVPKQYLSFGKPLWCDLGVQAILSGRVSDASVEYVACTNYVHGLQRGCRWNHTRAQ